MKHRTLQAARKADPSLWEIKKNAEGKPLCRMCSGVVKPPRRSFCSEACVHEYKIRSDIRYARRQVRKRDKGVCAICKVNTKEQEKEVWKLATHAQRVVKAAEFGVPKHRVGDSYWDMDHIIPVSEGGGACGLENLQTLCIQCHRKKTSDMAKNAKKRCIARHIVMVVYFIQCGKDGPIKIGYSKNVMKRLIAIQLNNPVTLTLLCTMDGAKKEEKQLHSKFKHDRILGEWFRLTGELQLLISSLPPINITVNKKGGKLEKNSCWKGAEASDNTKRQRAVRMYNLRNCDDCGAPGHDRFHENGLDDIENIIVLCRKCCMKKDGRMVKFIEQAKLPKLHLRKDPVRCRICGEVKRHHSKGRCKACYEFFRRTGKERRESDSSGNVSSS